MLILNTRFAYKNTNILNMRCVKSKVVDRCILRLCLTASWSNKSLLVNQMDTWELRNLGVCSTSVGDLTQDH